MAMPAAMDPARFASTLVASLFGRGNANAPFVGGPYEILIWHNQRYDWTQIPNLVLGSNATVARARLAIEKWLLGRPLIAVGEPIGSSDFAAQNAWDLANCLGDDWHRNPTRVAWTPGGGSQLPSPCVFDSNSPAWTLVDRTAAVTIGDILGDARNHLLTENQISILEHSRAALNAIWR
jgi:hypothetical protein